MTMLNFDEIFVTRNYFGKPVRRNADTFVKGEGPYDDSDGLRGSRQGSLHPHARPGDETQAEARVCWRS
jgi:hypothetical protein